MNGYEWTFKNRGDDLRFPNSLRSSPCKSSLSPLWGFAQRLGAAAACLLALTLSGCWSTSDSEVVVYTAQDAEFAKPIFDDLAAHSAMVVLPKYDAESTKTVGLVTEIIEEAPVRGPMSSGTTRFSTQSGWTN